MPTKDALIKAAVGVATTSERLKRAKITATTETVRLSIDTLEGANLNFRYVAANTEAFLLVQAQKAAAGAEAK